MRACKYCGKSIEHRYITAKMCLDCASREQYLKRAKKPKKSSRFKWLLGLYNKSGIKPCTWEAYKWVNLFNKDEKKQ